MEEIRKALANKGVDLDKLDIREWGDSLHIVRVTTNEDEDTEYYDLIVFPTQDMFVKTLQYINKTKQSYLKDNPEWLTGLAEYIRTYKEKNGNLEMLVKYIWDIEDESLTQEIIYDIDSLSEELGTDLYMSHLYFAEYCRVYGLHNEHMYSDIDELVPKTTKCNDYESKHGIYIDENAENCFWFAPLESMIGCCNDDFFYTLTPEEQIKAKEEVEKADKKMQEEDCSFSSLYDMMPLSIKAYTLVLEEIAENF